MTGTAGAPNPQVRSQIRVSPLVAKSAPRTLSRWRHGFEPRWDYQERAQWLVQALNRRSSKSAGLESGPVVPVQEPDTVRTPA